MKFCTKSIFLMLLSIWTLVVECASNKKLLKETKRGSNNIIKLTDDNFRAILKPTRDSHIVVFLTATQDDIGCTLCQAMEEEYNVLAESWFKTHPDGINNKDTTGDRGLFFAKADYSDGGNTLVFQHFRASQVPLLYVFGPETDADAGINTFQQLNIPSTSSSGDERVNRLINSFTHYFELENYKLYKPIDYVSRTITTLSLIGVLFLMKKYSNIVSMVIQSRILWACFCTLFIIIMCNGYMFNKIRGSQYAGKSQSGIEYFQGGMQNQYAIETQIVSFIYGVLAMSALLMAKLIPYSYTYFMKKQKQYNAALSSVILTFLFLTIIFFFSSALMYVFRQKHGGYPFKFLK
ncbi:unnamed protein product [Hanseniaspora opuntiae]